MKIRNDYSASYIWLYCSRSTLRSFRLVQCHSVLILCYLSTYDACQILMSITKTSTPIPLINVPTQGREYMLIRGSFKVCLFVAAIPWLSGAQRGPSASGLARILVALTHTITKVATFDNTTKPSNATPNRQTTGWLNIQPATRLAIPTYNAEVSRQPLQPIRPPNSCLSSC